MEIPVELFRRVGIDTPASGIESLGGGGGFSGAQLWRCSNRGDDWCLRRWPLGTNPERVAWVQSVIAQVSKHTNTLAVAVADVNGASYFCLRGFVYEVIPWLSGSADYWDSPSDEKLGNAMRALAKWHLAAEDFTAGENLEAMRAGQLLPTSLSDEVHRQSAGVATSPGIAMRAARCDELLQGKLDVLAAAAAADHREFVRQASDRLIGGFKSVATALQASLRPMAKSLWRQQICLRDIWHDHLLFTGDEVTGIVDYDAMRIESAVGDVARLLGSLVGDDQVRFETGLAAYHAIRPLMDAERGLLSVWDASNAAMAGLQWLEWLSLEERIFADETAVKRLVEKHAVRAAGLG